MLEAVKLMVDQHVDVNAVDDTNGDAPLHIAASHGFSSIVQYLVDHGANLHLANYNGETPLAAATDAGRRGASTAELLRKLGARY